MVLKTYRKEGILLTNISGSCFVLEMPRERKVPAKLRDSANLNEIEAAEEENGSPVSNSSPKKARKDSNSSSDLASPTERVTALTMTMAQPVTDQMPIQTLHGQNMHINDSNRYQSSSTTTIVYPCGICKRNVDDNDDAILCETGCGLWYHRVCTGLTELAYNLLTSEDNAEWVCNACIASKTIPLVKLKS